MSFQERRPSAAALAWVERALGRGARVVACRRLTGGLTAAVHRLTVATARGRHVVVLRRFEVKPASQHATRDKLATLMRREAAVLDAVATTGLLAPALLAVSPTGDEADGQPSLLMTRLPGRVNLVPRDRERWLRQIAVAAARIHDARVEAPRFERWLDPTRLTTPASSKRPRLWQRLKRVLQEDGGTRARCFIHRDFQHFNFLWTRDRLSGVVDWGAASMGPPGLDVGHCRLNLAVLFGAGEAERLRLAYEAESGRRVDAWWDLHALASYGDAWPRFIPLQVDGRAPVDTRGMTARVEDVLAAALRRL